MDICGCARHMCYHSLSHTMTQTPPSLPPLNLHTLHHQSGDRPLVFQELRVPRNGEPHVGVSPVRVQRYDHSPYRANTAADWRDSGEEDFQHGNGVFALQEKINLLKNHPSEIFNFMVVSGSPRLGKNFRH